MPVTPAWCRAEPPAPEFNQDPSVARKKFSPAAVLGTVAVVVRPKFSAVLSALSEILTREAWPCLSVVSRA